MTTLSNLMPGQHGTIHAIQARSGFISTAKRSGFPHWKADCVDTPCQSFNGPLHVRIGATDIILREIEAQRIQLDLV